MQVTHSEARQPNSVIAMFDDGLSTFLLSCDATFEDLAGRLGQLAERHHGTPLAINVKLGSRR
jgi:hypothetical protein